MASSSKDDSKYDVYLSSGGEDTRRTFTDHLYCSLKDHRVNVFMYGDEYDDKLEESNGAIPEHLIQAIERSKVAVVVFSRGYPESLWCLKELVKIMECRETLGQMFFPIFFDVDPSDVRKQSGSFAQAFQKYEQKINEDKVCLWRKALWEAGVLAGLNFRETDGHEGNFIRNVISQITGKQSITTSLEVPTNLVGIDSRVRDISKHLDVGGSNDIRTIGILGMCGLGKTTVAKAIFNKHHHNFDGASFLQNVREKKLIDLQEQLLSDILKAAYIGVSCIDEGTKEIEQRLGNRRVLVVIDDLDSVADVVHVKYYDEEPLKLDIVISFPDHGFHLRFDPWSQRLRLVEIFDIKRLQMRYATSLIGGPSTLATFVAVYALFGPTFPGIYDKDRGVYTLFYPGLSFAFPIPSQYTDCCHDREAELPLEFPDGTTPVTCRVSIYDSSTDKKVGVGSLMDKASAPPLPVGSLYMEEVHVKLGEELYFTVGGQNIPFGASPQDVWTELGRPCGIHQKQVDQMVIHSGLEVSSLG